MRWTRRFAVISTLALALMPSGPVAAECIGPWTPMPSFTAVAPSAERVILGTVIQDLEDPQGLEAEGGGITPSFVIAVDTVLRGPDPGPTLTLDLVATGVPQSEECGGRPTVFATPGDRIAVAFEGRLPGHRRPITAAAWIEGQPDALGAPDAEVLTMAEVRDAITRMPDTSTAGVAEPSLATILKWLLGASRSP